MKNIYALIIGIIFLWPSFLKVYGQKYTPFIDTNSTWRDERTPVCEHGASALEDIWWEEEVYLKGDTVIGNTYKKLYATGNRYFYSYYNGTIISDSGFYCNYYLGGLREDSLKHVYYIDTTGFEKLLFNFNLSIGDSVPYGYNGGFVYAYMHVQTIDSIYIVNKYRKRFIFDLGISLIEGIGMEYGLLGVRQLDPLWVCQDDHAEIYFYNNVKAYCFPNTTDTTVTLFNCNITNIKEIQENKVVEVFPNPTSNFITIDISKASTLKDEQLYVIDNLGNIILKQVVNSNTTKIDLSNLSNGFYFLKFVGIQSKESVIKIIKTN